MTSLQPILINLNVFKSSKGASTSSRRQKGAGFSSKIAKTNASAVKAFSPLDNSQRDVFLLPGGCASIDISASKGSGSPVKPREALPPSKKRLNKLETSDTLFQADLLKKAEQEPKNLEMYMLIEHLAGQIESIEKEIEASRYNKVNIDHLKEQVDMLQKKANGNH